MARRIRGYLATKTLIQLASFPIISPGLASRRWGKGVLLDSTRLLPAPGISYPGVVNNRLKENSVIPEDGSGLGPKKLLEKCHCMGPYFHFYHTSAISPLPPLSSLAITRAQNFLHQPKSEFNRPAGKFPGNLYS